MRKKRIMIIGPSGCGKTSLANHLNEVEKPLRKTQNIIYGERTIDVPGSYIENTWMYKHLIATAQTASHILILVDPERRMDVYSPGFAKAFKKPTIGVISKSDVSEISIEHCVRQLRQIGVPEPYFQISTITGAGIQELKDYLFDQLSTRG